MTQETTKLRSYSRGRIDRSMMRRDESYKNLILLILDQITKIQSFLVRHILMCLNKVCLHMNSICPRVDESEFYSKKYFDRTPLAMQMNMHGEEES